MDIVPNKGVGNLKFGMTIQEVRSKLASTVSSFKNSPSSEIETDAFDDLGIYVHYKMPGICNAIELAYPADPKLYGELLIGRNFSELRNWFMTIDDSIEENDSGITSYKFGIGLYAPFAIKFPNEPVESVIIFEPDYYSS